MIDYVLIRNLTTHQIFTFRNGIWELTPLWHPVSKSNFIAHGFQITQAISQARWLELNWEEIEFMMWSPINDELKFRLTAEEMRSPIHLLNDPYLMIYSTVEPAIDFTAGTTTTIRYSVSRNAVDWLRYSDGWIPGVMTKAEVESLTNFHWKELYSSPIQEHSFYFKIDITSDNPNRPGVKEVIFNFAPEKTILTDTLIVQTPNMGFKQELNEVTMTYTLKLEEGFAFDDAVIDYNFFTTGDRIKLRPITTGRVLGGQVSSIWEFEVINGHEDFDFNVSLIARKGVVDAKQVGNYALLEDAPEDRDKTKVEMSLHQVPFSPMYPTEFRLNKLEKRIVYIRFTPQSITTGNETFQIRLNARPIL